MEGILHHFFHDSSSFRHAYDLSEKNTSLEVDYFSEVFRRGMSAKLRDLQKVNLAEIRSLPPLRTLNVVAAIEPHALDREKKNWLPRMQISVNILYISLQNKVRISCFWKSTSLLCFVGEGKCDKIIHVHTNSPSRA